MPAQLITQHSTLALAEIEVPLAVIPVLGPEDPDIGPGWDDAIADYRRAGRQGRPGEDLYLVRRTTDKFRADAVLLVGLGPRPQVSTDLIRSTAQRIGSEYSGVGHIATTLHRAGTDRAVAAEAVVDGLVYGAYHFLRYRTREIGRAGLSTVTLTDPDGSPEVLVAARRAATLAAHVSWARDLVNIPAADLTPDTLAAAVEEVAAEPGLSVTIRRGEELASGRFDGLTTVGRGSANPPCLIDLTYTSASPDPLTGRRRRVALVGKGITFDSGGLSLKKTSAMLEMKSDMAGGAAVLAAVRALAALEVPGLEVTALVPAAENLPGPGAMRPGDVIRHRNGVTTEIADPDCEGRLVLADALVLAAESEPEFIVDAATLTYACVTALGTDITAAVGNDATLMNAVRAAGDAVGEPIWELPLWHAYLPLIASPVADLRNEGSTDDAPGVITSALFLHQFVDETPWVHLDIGGTGYVEEAGGPVPVGSTGVMVRTLTRLLSRTDHGPFVSNATEGQAR